MIDSSIKEISTLPEITTSLTLFEFAGKIQSLYQAATPNKRISVVIDRIDAFIEVKDCSDGCFLLNHQVYINDPNNELLSCKPTFNMNGHVYTSLYSKNALIDEKITICGIKFGKQ